MHVPCVSFTVKPKCQTPWLMKKRDFIERKWNQKGDGARLIKKVSKVCNLPFPKSINSIEVTLEPHSRGSGFLGLTDAFKKPNEITLFVKKRDRYFDIKQTLCHELVHSLCWCNTKHDQRRTTTSFFADTFSDELLTTLLESYIVKGRMTHSDYEQALDYARNETCNSLKNLKRNAGYNDLVSNVALFLCDYRKRIKNGSNALLQRQRMLKDLISPHDS